MLHVFRPCQIHTVSNAPVHMVLMGQNMYACTDIEFHACMYIYSVKDIPVVNSVADRFEIDV